MNDFFEDLAAELGGAVERAADVPAPAEHRSRTLPAGVRLRALAGPLGALAVVAVIAGVVVGVLAAVHGRPQVHAGARDSARSAVPSFSGGMRGSYVYAEWASFSGENGYVWLLQCIGCVGESSKAKNVWLATTTNGGASWRVERRRQLVNPQVGWDGENGWSSAVGRGASRFVVTHDGGQTWSTVRIPRSLRPGGISVANGTVWANASRCRGPYRCVYPVMRGPASGSRLTPVPTTPSDRSDLNVIAVSSTRAYVFSPTGDSGARQAWVTDDGGRSWQSVAPGCPESQDTVFPTAGADDGTIWRSCAPVSNGHNRVGLSTDGGRRWVYRSVPFSVQALYPESTRVAWAQNLSGTTLRSDDGGRSWRTVWTVNKSLPVPHGKFRFAPTPTARSATAATEVVRVVHTDPRTHHTLTNLLVYRTTDGGTHWDRSAVALPHG